MSVTEILTKCDEEIFPLINSLLTILLTLPISNASSEITFSTLRSTMSGIRLNGLALLNIHRDIDVDTNKVIEMFSKTNRKLDFALLFLFLFHIFLKM